MKKKNLKKRLKRKKRKTKRPKRSNQTNRRKLWTWVNKEKSPKKEGISYRGKYHRDIKINIELVGM